MQTVLVKDWKAPEAAYDAGNRDWLPCTEEFYMEMLEVLPPMDYYPSLGLFGVCEGWKGNGPNGYSGATLHLFFCYPRQGKGWLCRMATRGEIRAEFREWLDPLDEKAKRELAAWRETWDKAAKLEGAQNA